jgi:hypothetical protein
MSSKAGLGNIIGAGTQGTTGFLTTLEGKLELQKAKKREKALGGRPLYETPETITDNQVLAEMNYGQGGLSDSAQQIFQDQNQRALANSIGNMLRVGGGLNSVSELYGILGTNIERLALMDDEINFRNLQFLVNQNEKMGEQIDKRFQLNEFAPWADEKQAIAEQRAIAHNKVYAGRTMIGQSGATIAGSDFSGMGGSGSGSKGGGGAYVSQNYGAYSGGNNQMHEDLPHGNDNYILNTYYGK